MRPILALASFSILLTVVVTENRAQEGSRQPTDAQIRKAFREATLVGPNDTAEYYRQLFLKASQGMPAPTLRTTEEPPVLPGQQDVPKDTRPIQQQLTKSEQEKLGKLLEDRFTGGQRSDLEPRIFGGVLATVGEFPHCVALLSSGNSSSSCCTGTLIGPDVVLTAAHCPIRGCRPRFVYFGLNANSGQIDRTKLVGVRAVKTHDDGSYDNDIALVFLDRPVSSATCPLATTADINAARELRIAGFGLTEQGQRGVLFTTDIAIFDHSCQGRSKGFTCHSKEMTGGNFGGQSRDTCNGDSGGPAYIRKSSGQLVLAGVTSRGSNPCGSIGVYTRVDGYLDWIDRTVKANSGSLEPVVPTAPVPPAAAPTVDMGPYHEEIRRRIDFWEKNYPKFAAPDKLITAPKGDAGKKQTQQPSDNGNVGQAAKAIAVIVGINRLQGDYYGKVPPLAGCVNDARDLARIAGERGFSVIALHDEVATRDAVVKNIEKAARDLGKGDIFLFSFAGYGGLHPDDDYNIYFMHDRPMLDSRLSELWTRFDPGVRIVAVFDTSHARADLQKYEDWLKEVNEEQQAGLKNLIAFSKDPTKEPVGPSPARSLPDVVLQMLLKNKKEDFVPVEAVELKGKVLSYEACGLDQFALEAGDHGLFTTILCTILRPGLQDDEAFTGDYYQLREEIARFLPRYQKPVYTSSKAHNARFEAQVPFTVSTP